MIANREHDRLNADSGIFLQHRVDEFCGPFVADVPAVRNVTCSDEDLATGERYLARRRITGRRCGLKAEIAAVASEREDRKPDP